MQVSPGDAPDRWRVAFNPDGITTTREDGPADVTLTGLASDLYLVLWNRASDSVINVAGDQQVLDLWHGNHRIRWED